MRVLILGLGATCFAQNPQGSAAPSTTSEDDNDGDIFKKAGCTVVKWGDDVADYAQKLPSIGPAISTTIKNGTTPANQMLGCPKPAEGNNAAGTSTAKLP